MSIASELQQVAVVRKQGKRTSSILDGLWHALTKPHALVIGAERRQARFLSAFLLTLALFSAGGVVLSKENLLEAGNLVFEQALIMPLLLFATYLVSRTDRYRMAALVSAFAVFALATGAALLAPTVEVANGALMYLALGVLVASIFLPEGATVLVGALNVLIVATFPLLREGVSYNTILEALLFNVVFTPLMALYGWHRNAVEKDRRMELLEINQELARHVKEAEEAYRAAEEANRLKSEFLATMSHELRTPLNAMIGFADLILMGCSGPISEDVHHQVERICANSKRLLGLINDILDLAKVEANRTEVVLAAMSPRKLAADLHEAMAVLAQDKELTFKWLVDRRVPEMIVSDQEHISRIVQNLLSNAIKFTLEGSVILRMLMGDDGKTWMIQVTDTGIGIPPHAQQYIFDEFRQVDGSSNREYGGTGLGLAIVRRYSRLLGGSVSVDSKLGVGSTFTIVLPLIVEDAPQSLHVHMKEAL